MVFQPPCVSLETSSDPALFVKVSHSKVGWLNSYGFKDILCSLFIMAQFSVL